MSYKHIRSAYESLLKKTVQLPLASYTVEPAYQNAAARIYDNAMIASPYYNVCLLECHPARDPKSLKGSKKLLADEPKWCKGSQECMGKSLSQAAGSGAHYGIVDSVDCV